MNFSEPVQTQIGRFRALLVPEGSNKFCSMINLRLNCSRAIKTTFLVGLAIASFGCGTTLTRGARAILPQQGADTTNVWVYLDTDDTEKNGVYRCRDVGEQVTCVKARLVTK